MNTKLSKEEFLKSVSGISNTEKINTDYLYKVYEDSYYAAVDLFNEQKIYNKSIDSYELISYILGEYFYSTSFLNKEKLEQFLSNEKISLSMSMVAADKYISLSVFNHKEQKLTSRYLPPISSIELYINLMLNIISQYKRNDPKNTLIVDLITKSLSIARSVIELLYEGYETEAFAIWRTLHECECTLILIYKYGDIAINAYLKHMEYGLAYKDAIPDKIKQDFILKNIKNEMESHALKSKDTKKYIEYGWLYAIPESAKLENFKLNFRDGLESLAGLHSKSEIYMMSSEILHSTPLLIYSNKQYFYLITLINLYESFFRIEEVFQPLFFSTVNNTVRDSYLAMRKLYYSQLINIYKREAAIFEKMQKKDGQ